ncbi:hypothetical protein D6C91_05580 [Aureobasidium pullulans]|uniref:DUF8035 domain-containing protein n=1 Tax=Aureobasidium pullulans TaxID=5580 RepID=A0A4S9T485_AURPU|nr:hypothetical protein D6C91_05580 [Aureobasidium pullulans]
MSYHRTSSPGSRRLAHPARLSDGYYPASATTTYPPSNTAYASPRSSGERIVPVSTTTFVTRDAYSGRPRRSTLTDPSRPNSIPTATTTNTTVPVHPRSRPAVIQSSHDRTHSPSSPLGYSTRASDYYAIPATSHRDHSHKKLYSIDSGGKSRLVADVDINTSHSSSHRRHSIDRNSDRHGSSHHRPKGYHLSGSSTRKSEADQGFSYTDPAAMYRETEPRWRNRAGSVEATRPRPSSALVEPYHPRSSAREPGPPTSRALDKFNDTAGRAATTREPPRSSNRLSYQEPQYNNDGYISSSSRHSTAVHQDRTRDVYPREVERARPTQRYEDRSVERRGFGIRSGSQDRYNHNMNKGSSESFDAYYSDRDREHPPPRSDPRAYDYPKDSDREREYRPRDKDRLRDDGYASERDRHNDRDRRDRDRRDRDRDVTPRGSGDSLTNTLLPAAATAAIGGLGAMAAAAYGSDTTVKGRDRDYEDRDRDRDRDRERDREREREQREREQEYERKQRDREKEHREREREKREREKERERDVDKDSEKERERLHDRETRPRDRPRERERDRPRHSSSSDSGQDKHRSSRRHRTLGDDNSPPQEKDTRFVPDERQRIPEPDERQRAPERERVPPVDPPAEIDPDEDYRRRMEQAQRDLGLHDNPDSDRERRARDTEPLHHRPPAPAAAATVDYPESTARENRVRIVEPPSDREDSQPVKGILKRPTQKFPEDPHPVREGVAPLKETTKDGIPAGARWTKIDRRLVNPKALEEAQERFEERLDCVIVLRVLTKDEIQKLADKTLAIREEARSYGEEDHERHERRENRRRERERERRERDEYEDHDSEDEYAPRAPRMLEAPVDGQEPAADFVRDRERRRDREREPAYASGAL